jgi:hypothetical protein
MGENQFEDVRTIRRHPALWMMPALAALGAVVCMPANMFFVRSITTDPQGEQQLREAHEYTVAFRHTSGFVFGMVLAALLGVLLFRRRKTDPRRAGRAAVAATVAWAALGGVILAAVNVGVARLLGGSTRVTVRGPDDPLVVDVFRDGVWQVVLGWAATFPVLAVVGVGLGALSRRGRM